MSDKKTAQKDRPGIKKVPSMVMPVDKTVTNIQINRPENLNKLVLDNHGQRPAKTRTALYKELIKDDKVMEDEDYFEFSNPAARAIGLAIDAVFAFVIVNVAMMAAPIEVKLVHLLILDKYKLVFVLGDSGLLQILTTASIFAVLFFLIVVPVAFFNVSIGKKITGQRVRGDNKYTLSLSQAFKRELIYKPIGIACLASFILPFFDKKKKALHDKLAKTFVIKG
ncbi:MAG: RDD family protein [Bacteriovorax sp.]|nr:RDD family protein [Bacteriovorax sp.]